MRRGRWVLSYECSRRASTVGRGWIVASSLQQGARAFTDLMSAVWQARDTGSQTASGGPPRQASPARGCGSRRTSDATTPQRLREGASSEPRKREDRSAPRAGRRPRQGRGVLSRRSWPSFLFAAPPQMAFFNCGGVRLVVGVPPDGQAAKRGSAIYFQVPEIGAVFSSLKRNGVSFMAEPHIVHRTPSMELWLAGLQGPVRKPIGAHG